MVDKAGPKGRRADAERRVKTSLVIPEGLWVRLRVAAVEERTDVSALLCRLVEDYLKRRKGGVR